MSQGKATLPDTHQAGKGAGDVRNMSKDQLLCASCDSCRAKKTKCDSKRPCEACVLSYIRRNKIASSKDVDVKKIKCVYSPAKKRGPPPKRTLEKEARGQEKKQRRVEEQSIAGRGQEMESSAANLNNNNLDAASVLNVLGMMLNTPASTLPPPAPPPPMSANFQQSILASLGSALGIQGVNMTQGVGGVAASNGGYNVVNHASSATSQQLAYLQQLQQQSQVQQLQRQLQQQLQQSLTQHNGQTTRRAESSITSSLEDTKTQAPQDEVGDLRRRIHELETENADLKQQLDALQKRR